jgi:hypothetical protein
MKTVSYVGWFPSESDRQAIEIVLPSKNIVRLQPDNKKDDWFIALRGAAGAKLLTTSVSFGDSDGMKGPIMQLKSYMAISSWQSFYGTIIEDNLLLYKDISSGENLMCCYGYSMNSVVRSKSHDKNNIFALKITIDGSGKELFFGAGMA